MRSTNIFLPSKQECEHRRLVIGGERQLQSAPAPERDAGLRSQLSRIFVGLVAAINCGQTTVIDR